MDGDPDKSLEENKRSNASQRSWIRSSGGAGDMDTKKQQHGQVLQAEDIGPRRKIVKMCRKTGSGRAAPRTPYSCSVRTGRDRLVVYLLYY